MPLTIQLPPLESQHAVNLARWAEVLVDNSYADIPGRAETDRYGHITMSPPAHPNHGRKQSKVAALFIQLLSEGETVTECPVSTSDGVKSIDVAWFSRKRFEQIRGQVCVTIAPEICVEVLSPSNTQREMEEKRALYFEAGASEFWVCGESGEMKFETKTQTLTASVLCPEFPLQILLD